MHLIFICTFQIDKMPLEYVENRKPIARIKQKSKQKVKCKITKTKKSPALCRLCGRSAGGGAKDDSVAISIFDKHRFSPCPTMTIQQAIDKLIGIQVTPHNISMLLYCSNSPSIFLD